MGDLQNRARVDGQECPHVCEQEGARGEGREAATLRWGLGFFQEFQREAWVRIPRPLNKIPLSLPLLWYSGVVQWRLPNINQTIDFDGLH